MEKVNTKINISLEKYLLEVILKNTITLLTISNMKISINKIMILLTQLRDLDINVK